MQNFLARHYIFMYVPIGNEISLIRKHHFVNINLRSVDYNFAKGFVNNIKKSNRSKLANLVWIVNLLNKTRLNLINLLYLTRVSPKVLDKLANIFPHLIPRLLEKTSRITIRTWQLPMVHIKDSLFYFCIFQLSIKLACIGLFNLRISMTVLDPLIHINISGIEVMKECCK